MSEKVNKKWIDRKTFLKYTGLFLVLSAVIFSVFPIYGKTFIWEGDGFHQHYPFFREYLTILRNFFETGNWQNWDWTIGAGADTLLTYGYYVVGDLFVYLGLLFPKGSEELAFHVLMLVRIWAVGVSFLFYARKMRFSEKSALTATVMYTFSHYIIYNVVRHPFFMHPLIFFPLIALGIEKLFRKESGILFAVMIGVSAISNFYFFYMLTLMAFLYAIVRYSAYQTWKDWSTFWQTFLSFLGYYIVGLFLSAVIFLPQIYGFLNASRSTGFPPVSLFLYPIHYYGLLIVNTITPGTIFWSVGGISVVAVLALPFLIQNRFEKRGLFSVLGLLSVMLLFPFFGSLMNGMSGPYNRFPFYFSILLAYFLDRASEMTEIELKRIRWMLMGFTIFYGIIGFMTADYILYLSPVVIGWGTYVVFKNYRFHPFFERMILGLVVLNMVTNALNFYLPHGKYAISETEDYGTVDANYAEIFQGVEKNLPKDEWYRVGVTANDNQLRNQYTYLNVNGMNSYASLTNGATADFSKTIESSQYQIIQPLRNGIDDRRIANQALGVKYILTDEEHQAYLPSGYMINEELSENEMIVVESEHAAPFSYVKKNVVLVEELEKMHPVQRESVLEEADSSLMLVLGQPEDLMGQEVFLYIEGIDFQPFDEHFLLQESTQYRLNGMFNDQEKRILQSDRYRFSSYFQRENILIHFNEVTELEESLELKFENTGSYTFERISLVSRPYDPVEAARLADEKQNQALIIQTFESDYVVGTIQNEEEGVLVTSIPYSEGWTVLADGEELPTEKVNIGFVGARIPAGEYEIEFVYETPYLKLGFAITIVGLVGVGLLYLNKIRE